ncbi:MAG TPA: type VI secretion system baseplate subunit TssF, partial [Rhodopila sp.]|nr:type VI secretion system baseplate subunit TssF [Rhodopila sp.]
MSDDLLRHFDTEYAALTRLAAEFAAANPRAAARLRLSRTEVDDPHVERLLEGVAFLGARVQQRLDDEFPELTDALLGVLYPHYLAPFPSCMMAQLTPRTDLQAAATIPRDSLVQTEAVDGTPCRFRFTAPVTLWPIEIESVRLTGLPLPSLPVRLATAAAGVLRITLRCTDPAMTFERLGMDTLRLHLTGGRQVSHALYELLCGHVVGVAFADSASDDRPVICPPSAVQPAGFGSDEAMLPWSAQGFAGFRLLSEYFAFPEKFLFIDIGGIGGKCDAGAGRRMEIFLYLNQLPPQLERAVDTTSFALGCVPLINLFPQRCEPIDLDWTRPEYRIDPDIRKPKTMEVWSVERVRETRLDGSERPWRPFFRMVHGDADAGQSGGFYLPLRRPSPAGLTGSDVFLAVDDPSFEPERTTRARLSVDALCSNRDMPRLLPSGDGRPRLQLEAGAASVLTIAPLSSPTDTLRPPPRGQRFWRLISHLSLSHLSVVGGMEGAGVLREVLRLYDLRDSSETRAVIAAL